MFFGLPLPSRTLARRGPRFLVLPSNPSSGLLCRLLRISICTGGGCFLYEGFALSWFCELSRKACFYHPNLGHCDQGVVCALSRTRSLKHRHCTWRHVWSLVTSCVGDTCTLAFTPAATQHILAPQPFARKGHLLLCFFFCLLTWDANSMKIWLLDLFCIFIQGIFLLSKILHT